MYFCHVQVLTQMGWSACALTWHSYRPLSIVAYFLAIRPKHDEHTGDMTAMLKSRNLKKSQPTGLSPRIHVSIQSCRTIDSNFIASQPVCTPT